MAPPQNKPRPAVFLDRDGVLNEDLEYVYRISDLHLIPGAAAALARLKVKGYLLIVISNQSGVARGLFGTAEVERFNAALDLALRSEGGTGFDDAFYCPHLPGGQDPAYAIACSCRKPAPGMILAAAAKHNIDLAQSLMVGDRASDMECAMRAGIAGIQLKGRDEKRHPHARAFVASLAEVEPYLSPSLPSSSSAEV